MGRYLQLASAQDADVLVALKSDRMVLNVTLGPANNRTYSTYIAPHSNWTTGLVVVWSNVSITVLVSSPRLHVKDFVIGCTIINDGGGV